MSVSLLNTWFYKKKTAKDTYFLIEIHFQDQGYQLEENWLINEGSVYYSFNKHLDPMVE